MFTTQFLLLIFVTLSFSFKASVYVKNGKMKIVEGRIDKTNFESCCWGTFSSEEDKEKTGWFRLNIETNEHWPDEIETAYCAGYLEGYFSYKQIAYQYDSLRHVLWAEEDKFKMPDYLRDYFNKQREYSEAVFQKNMNDPYYMQVKFMNRQLEGLIDGYNKMAELNDFEILDYAEFQTMNAYGDMYDLKNYKKKDSERVLSKMSANEIEDHFIKTTSCSAIVKITHGYEDIMFSHNTWSSPSGMGLRLFKEYNFNYNSSVSKYIQFSGRPGIIAGLDDWYITGNDLAVMETTNSCFNDKLFELLTPKSLLYWQRVMVANRLAKNAKNWMEIFEKENSGTYNNQWMVLDLSKFVVDKGLLPEAFFIGEQYSVGGYYYEDKTEYLNTNMYHPSYNVPMFDQVNTIMGYKDTLKKHPELESMISYTNCSRAKIFKREHSKVRDLMSMKKLIRFNDYKNDPFSHSDPAATISARYDQREENPKCHAAIDAKIGSYQLWHFDKASAAISSPAFNEDLPPFSWTDENVLKACPAEKYKHKGHPTTFMYGWNLFTKSKY